MLDGSDLTLVSAAKPAFVFIEECCVLMPKPKLDTDVLDELRTEFGVDILVDLLRMARSSAETELNELSRQIDVRGAQKMRRIAHSLVGILGQYGAMDAARCAKETQIAPDEDLEQHARILIESGRSALDELHSFAEALRPTSKVA